MSTTDDGVRVHRRSLRRAARGTALNLVGSAVAAVAGLAVAVTMTRLAPSADVAGLFFSATSLFLLAINLCRLGTNTGLVYFISGAHGRGEYGLSRIYLRTAAVPVAVGALLVTVAMFVGAEDLAERLSSERVEAFATSIRLMALLVPFAVITQLVSAASQGLGTMKLYAVLEHMVVPVLQLLLVAVFLVMGGGALVSVGWSAAFVPAAVVGWLWWRRLVAKRDGQPEGRPAVSSASFWKFTAPRALASLSQIAMQRLDIVLVGALANLTAAAIYAALTRFLVLGQMASSALSLSVQPLLGAALARRDLGNARDLYQTCTAWLVLGSWPMYLALIVLAPWVLRIFGEGYDAGVPSLVTLCAAMLFATACGMVDMVLNMAGKSLWNMVNVLIALGLFLGLNLLLIPRLGVLGAAISWAAAIVVKNALPLIQIRIFPGAHPFGKATLLAMGLAGICLGLVPWAAHVMARDSLLVSILGVAVGLVAYLAVVVRARHVFQLPLLVQSLRRRRGAAAT